MQGRRAGLLCTLIITSISPQSYHTVIPLPAPIKTIKVASVMKTNGHLVKVKIITAPSSVITANCSIVNMGLVELHSPQNNHKTSRIWNYWGHMLPQNYILPPKTDECRPRTRYESGLNCLNYTFLPFSRPSVFQWLSFPNQVSGLFGRKPRNLN